MMPAGDSATSPGEYPVSRAARDRWIIVRRSGKNPTDAYRPHGYFLEVERGPTGRMHPTLTVFLTNRECPWRCLMCDLWKTTLAETVPIGAIPAQIDYALEQLLPELRRVSPGSGERTDAMIEHAETGFGAPTIKLYNGGSFFDPRAIPCADYDGIAARVGRFERVIVECHPAFVGNRCLQFRDALVNAARADATQPNAPQLEVAMGLETAHPAILEKLNKGMTLSQFNRAAEFLRSNGLALRVFMLVKPPFLDEAGALHWAERSLEFAFEAGAAVASLIPTRAGNGAMEALQQTGQFSPPKLATLEAAHAFGIGLRQGRVFADLWDLEKFSHCSHCFPQRLERIRTMNLEQALLPPVPCAACRSPALVEQALTR